MASSRYKHFKYDVNYMIIEPGTRILHEFDIPSIVSDEAELKALAEKRGLSILFQIREGASRPVVRILRRIADFPAIASFVAEDDFTKKMDRSFRTLNLECYRSHRALILPVTSIAGEQTRNIPKLDSNRLVGGRGFSVTGMFERTGSEYLTLNDLVPILNIDEALLMHHSIELYRDKTDPDNIWKLKYSGKPDYNGNNMKRPIETFVKNAQNQLGISSFQYRVKV